MAWSKIIYFHVALQFILSVLQIAKGSQFPVSLSNNGPAIVGGSVTFTANMSDYSPGVLTQYYVTWTDKFHEEPVSIPAAANMSWNVTYHHADTITLRIMVIKKLGPFIPFATGINSTKFQIQDTIPGSLKMEQTGLSLPAGIVSTRNETNLTFTLHDPNGFFHDAQIDYVWTIVPPIGTLPTLPRISVNFTNPNITYTVDLTVIAILQAGSSPKIYDGSFGFNVRAKDPITKLNIMGSTWLRHGELLRLNVSCSGSPPFSYCWHFRTGDVNKSEEHCSNPITSTDCQFYIIRYFSDVGNYKAVTIINNDIDHNVQVTDINIFNVVRQSQLSVIVLPVVCSILVLGIIVFGISYYIQNRHRFTVEEADFDFQASDSLEYRTVSEILKDEFTEMLFGSRGSSERGSMSTSSDRYGDYSGRHN